MSIYKDVIAEQIALRDLGYYTGRIDGIWGPLTDAAYKQYLSDQEGC
jgi:peptidoglycan hydrolase-like protein with peptidoglycan-binding domain